MLSRSFSRPAYRCHKIALMSSKPVTRLEMVQHHLSTSSSSSTGASVHLGPDALQPVVLFEAVHALRKMTLNRTKALNALNEEMINLIQPQLLKWESSDLANIVLFKGNGRSFCAGGDVKTLVDHLGDPATRRLSSEFFEKEYATDAFIAKMKTPIISIMHGNTLGGGVGLAVHAPFRIATETTKIGMPETKIGLFPDVGANFFLSRMDGALGLFLGLTGHTVSGAGTLFAGFATHLVPQARLDALEARLAELEPTATHDDVNAAIEEFSADAIELQSATYDLVGPKRRAIDIIFSRQTAEEIMADLTALENGTLDIAKIIWAGDESEIEALKAWAKETRETIDLRSPTSVKLTILALREGKSLDIDNAFKLDMRIATACCNPDVHPDFRIGVNHVLVDKTKSKPARPAWTPSTLEGVSVPLLQKVFFGNPPPFDNPPVPGLALRDQGVSYKAYPHARFGLPSEIEIRDIVTGEDKGSDDYALLESEVIKKVLKQRKGKIGVEEKVREVIKRRCEVQAGGTLKWQF